jgi:hypothetical protein
MKKKPTILNEVLFEFRPQGHYVQVAAIDPISGTEVSMVGDARQNEEVLKRIAARKLLYVMEKQRAEKKKKKKKRR